MKAILIISVVCLMAIIYKLFSSLQSKRNQLPIENQSELEKALEHYRQYDD